MSSFANEFNHANNVPLQKQIEAYFEFTKFLYRRIQNLELGRESFILKDTTLLVEGIERYMTSKISIKAFCPVDSDDATIDAELSKNLVAFKWIKEEHLDIPSLDSDFHYEEARKSKKKKTRTNHKSQIKSMPPRSFYPFAFSHVVYLNSFGKYQPCSISY